MDGIWLIAFLTQWLLVLFLVLIVAGILRQLKVMQERWDLAAPPITTYDLGERIADFELSDAAGEHMLGTRLLQLSDGGVILFISSTCSACAIVATQISDIVSRPHLAPSKMFIVIVVEAVDRLRWLFDEHPGLRNQNVVLLTDENGDVARQFGVRSVPTGLAVDKGGQVISQSFNPHVGNWLYKSYGVHPPTEPISQTAISLRVPGIYSRQG